MKIEINDREMLFLSDLLGMEQNDISDELEEIARDPDLDNLRLEMRQDLALCKSILAKLQIPETDEDTPQ